jgi:hypothetical protein
MSLVSTRGYFTCFSSLSLIVPSGTGLFHASLHLALGFEQLTGAAIKTARTTFRINDMLW